MTKILREIEQKGIPFLIRILQVKTSANLLFTRNGVVTAVCCLSFCCWQSCVEESLTEGHFFLLCLLQNGSGSGHLQQAVAQFVFPASAINMEGWICLKAAGIAQDLKGDVSKRLLIQPHGSYESFIKPTDLSLHFLQFLLLTRLRFLSFPRGHQSWLPQFPNFSGHRSSKDSDYLLTGFRMSPSFCLCNITHFSWCQDCRSTFLSNAFQIAMY